ncbi:hypothetical protein E4U42_001297 [Claviceps africana]|uniref:Uncharacterized protein n=1 Tax=Claviceps africana TaxID=83212 RepID=A0A8K0IZE6_9HYPO|nr:hypothetical protein E4U42_001297 [Claviceps africana]
MPRRASRRPLISAPLGPVKTSRGPDLMRSEGLELVDSIKDCCESASSTPAVSIASRRSRRISASFLSTAAPSTSPIVAASDVNAVTRMQPAKVSKPSFSKRPALLALSTRSLLKQPSRYTLVARSTPVEDDEENLEPGKTKQSRGRHQDQSIKPMSPQKMESKLPRSRTMTVFHGLKKSFSRPSLAAVRTSGLETKMTPSKTSPPAKRAGSMSSPVALTASSSSPSSSSSPPGTTTTPTSGDATPTSAASIPPRHVRQIDAAQSSEYWSGRFMALQDRFLSEDLDDDSLPMHSSPLDDPCRGPQPAELHHQSLTSSRNRLTYLAPSNTTSALTTITYNPRRRPDDEDDVRRARIFSHLDSLCSTDEARKSLRLWQQSYARRVGCPKLLPREENLDTADRKKMLLGSVGSRFKSMAGQEGVLRKPLPMPSLGRGAAFAVKPGSTAVC